MWLSFDTLAAKNEYIKLEHIEHKPLNWNKLIYLEIIKIEFFLIKVVSH